MRATLDRDRDRAEIQRTAQLVPRNLQHGSRFQLGTDPAHHLCDELLSRQGLRELLRRNGGARARAQPPRRSPAGGRARRPGRFASHRWRPGQHADHLVLCLHRHPGPALRSDPRREPGTDPRRARDVVDRHGRRVEDGARDPRRLVLRRSTRTSCPPVGRLAVQLRVDAGRLIAFVVDTTTPAKPTPSRAVTLRTSGALRRRACAPARARSRCPRPPRARGRGPRRAPRPRGCGRSRPRPARARASARGAAGRAANATSDRREREPRVAAERRPFAHDEHAEDAGGERDPGKTSTTAQSSGCAWPRCRQSVGRIATVTAA